MEIGSARVTCRPKELSNQFQKVLLCSASKIAVLSITKTDKRHENLFKIPDQSFEIKFSAEGVQYVRPNKKEEKLDYNDFIIQDVIEQFDNSFALSVEAKSGMKNYRNKKDRLHFIHNSKRNSEDTGDSLCNSTMKITYKPLNIFRNKNHIRNHKIYDNYKNIQNQMHKTYLRLLSKSNTNSNETFSVERFTMACPYQPQNIFFANTTWKISKTVIAYLFPSNLFMKIEKIKSNISLTAFFIIINSPIVFECCIYIHPCAINIYTYTYVHIMYTIIFVLISEKKLTFD